MPDIEHIALRLRKARLALDAIQDRAQLAKDDPAPPVGGGQPAASSTTATTDDVHVAGLAEVVRRKKRVEALAQKSAELLAKFALCGINATMLYFCHDDGFQLAH